MKEKIERFEHLVAWQKSRHLAKTVYGATLESRFAHDFALCNQIRKAAISMSSNVAEGFERDTLKEFHHFVSIAKGSCAEVRSQLYLALDLGYVDHSNFQQLMSEAEETSRVLGGLRAALQRKLGTQHSALGT
jgi:four helix bundle protein